MLRKLTAVSVALLPTLTATHLVMAQQPPINPFTGQPMPAVPSGGGTPVPGGFSMPGITIQAPQAAGTVATPARSIRDHARSAVRRISSSYDSGVRNSPLLPSCSRPSKRSSPPHFRRQTILR